MYFDSDTPLLIGRAYGRVDRHLLREELLKRYFAERTLSYPAAEIARGSRRLIMRCLARRELNAGIQFHGFAESRHLSLFGLIDLFSHLQGACADALMRACNIWIRKWKEYQILTT